MDRQAVESKDRDVVKKFRSVVEEKERVKKQKKSRLKLIAGLVIVCGAALSLFFDQFTLKNPQPVPEEKMAVVDSPHENDKAPALSSTGRAEETSIIAEAPEQQAPEDSGPALKNPQFEKNAGDFQNTDMVMGDARKILSKSSPKKSLPDAVKIAKVVACRDVIDRRHVSPQEEFSVKRDGKVFVWMDVRSKQLPQKLRHIYFVNNRRYRTVSLPVQYPQMRTWSGVSLNGSRDVGKWRVDVVSEQGQTLSHIDFKVVP